MRQGAPVEEHVDSEQEMEAGGEDQPIPDERLRGGDPAPDGTLSYDEVELRRQIAATVEPHVFPATKDDLVSNARDRMAEPRVISLLEALPGERNFENVQQVWEALGGARERRA